MVETRGISKLSLCASFGPSSRAPGVALAPPQEAENRPLDAFLIASCPLGFDPLAQKIPPVYLTGTSEGFVVETRGIEPLAS